MLTQFQTACLSLARVIEDGVAKNEVPNITRDLPKALKQVCRRNHDGLSMSMIMSLLFSARTACKLGWFSEDDAREISKLADEMSTYFCGPASADVGSILSESSLVTAIMSRFFPSLRLGKMLASLEAKPGYGTYICDFHIVRDDFLHSVKEEVRLLVARMDITETSSCLVSPEQVSFVMNGVPIGGRNCVDMIPGPQPPTDVSAMLKYGTNLLQVVGQFDGPCVILVAFMSMGNECDSASLPQYVPWNATVPDTAADSDLIEGPSRITLNCPISQRRIKLPVKGHSCKHPQCFDFKNFVDMNSRRPSWRCPHCNQSICYPDIRVDQTLAMILQEVRDDITEVMISLDGSWRAVMEADDDESPSKDSNGEKNANREEGIAVPIMNVIEIDNQVDVDPILGTEDRKPLQSELLSGIRIVNPELAVGQDSAVAGSLNVPPLPSNLVSDVSTSMSTSQVDFGTVTLPQLLTPAVSNHIRQSTASVTLQEALLSSATTGFASRPLGVNGNAFDVEYAHISNLRPKNITRVPIAVQALPVPSHFRKLAGQRARRAGNQLMPNVYPSQNLPQQPMACSYPQVASSNGSSAEMFSQSSHVHLSQSLNQFLSAPMRTHSPPVGQVCLGNIQNSSNGVGQQASTCMPRQLASVRSQTQGFAATSFSRPAAFSTMISEQNQLMPNVYPLQNLPQRPMTCSIPQDASSYEPSPTMFSQYSTQFLNQYLSASLRTHSPPVGQPCLRNIQNSLNGIGQQASHSTPNQLESVHSQIQGFAASNSSGPAGFSVMISEHNQLRPHVYPSQNLPQQPMVCSYPQVASSYGSSAAIFSRSSNAHLPQSLNQYLTEQSRTYSPPVGQPCLGNIQNSLCSVNQQVSPSTHRQLAAAHYESNTSGSAAFSAMTSEQNRLPLGRMRGSLSGQALDNLSQRVILPTQVALPTESTQNPPSLPPPLAAKPLT